MREVDEHLLQGMGRLLRDEASRNVEPAADAAGSARLANALAADAKRRSNRRVTPRLGWSLAAAGLMLTLVGYFVWPAASLQYTIEGAELSEGGYVASSTPDGARIRFSDGSEVVVGVDSSVRVSTVTAAGARVQLEHGHVDVSVVPKDGAAWFVDAGPYEIEVTGTQFSVDWSRRDRTLRTALSKGSVVVRGPLAPAGVRLQEGHELVAQEGEGQMRIHRIGSAPIAAMEEARDAAMEEARDAPAETAPRNDSAGDAADAPSAQPSPSGKIAREIDAAEPTLHRGWSKRVAEGDFEGVFADAEARGIEQVLQSGTGGDVSALSDAARYVGRGDVYHQALLALRKRFPKSQSAKNAAFLLGRMVHDGGSPSGAIVWYDRYLSESPGGMFSTEALGRKMVAVRSVQGPRAAQPLARAYLKSAPNGGFANVAKDILKR